jgi:DNA mismatch endonuclease (patch repair protein)
MVGNRRRDSKPELLIRSALHRAGHRFRVDFLIRLPGRRAVRPDVVFTRAKVAVFIDGCFWHGCPEHGRPPRANSTYWAAKIELNQNRDHIQTETLTLLGWAVVRIWEHEDPDAAVVSITAALRCQAASDSVSPASADATAQATA